VTRGDVAALESLRIDDILVAQHAIAALDPGDRNAPDGRTFGVVEDGKSLPKHPLESLKLGERRGLRIALGHNRDEVRMWLATGALRIPNGFEDVAAEVARFAGAEHGGHLFGFYRKRFPQADPAGLREKFLGDAIYVVPAIRTAETHASAAGVAYLYRFDWTPPDPYAHLGASHAFDEAFIWNVVDAGRFPPSTGDPGARELGSDMSSALIAFANDGNPGWSPIGERSAMRVFGDPTTTRRQVDSVLLNAWRGVNRR
jgi:para-nitrobenzyl esterase